MTLCRLNRSEPPNTICQLPCYDTYRKLPKGEATLDQIREAIPDLIELTGDDKVLSDTRSGGMPWEQVERNINNTSRSVDKFHMSRTLKKLKGHSRKYGNYGRWKSKLE